MIDSDWWQGHDKEHECSRLEFIGLLELADPDNPGHPAHGFDHWASWIDLVYVMSSQEESKSKSDYQMTVKELK